MRNRTLNSTITPVPFSDHKLITVECSLITKTYKSSYWHFNVKLLEDTFFCENFKNFWEVWKTEKGRYDNIIQWWEIGKVFIKEYCQQYSSHSTLSLKKTLESLEQELKTIEGNMIVNASPNLKDMWTEKKNCLNLILDEKVKGELIKKRFLTKRDIDAPTSFFLI